jgi:hypothetical protein
MYDDQSSSVWTTPPHCRVQRFRQALAALTAPHALRTLDIPSEAQADLSMLLGYDDDLAEVQATFRDLGGVGVLDRERELRGARGPCACSRPATRWATWVVDGGISSRR